MKLFASAFAGVLTAVPSSTHVIAQQAGAGDPQEQTVYQTRGIVLDPKDIADWGNASYWEQKLGEAFKLTVDTRMKVDAEERDAVLATVWQLKPPIIVAQTRIVAIIPRRPAKPQSKDLAYQITFIPRTTAQDRDRLEALFVSEGPGVRPIAASAPAAGAVPRLPPAVSYAGFPQDNFSRYLAEHPDETKSVLGWIGSSAGPVFDQILTASNGKGVLGKGIAERPACFHVRGTKTPTGVITSLGIIFLGETAPVMAAVPAQYNAKDFADLQIERIQAETVERGKLGAVSGLAQLPADEQLPAKYAIWQYFGKGTRDAEIDAIVPVPRTDKHALLTFRFGADNNVSIQRMGEDRKGSVLGRAGDVRQVNGFGANSADAPALMAWLKKRYPAVTPQGMTVAEVAASVTAEIQKRSATPAWFRENYGIDILVAGEAKGQLARLFQHKEQQLSDLKEFTASELQMLEVTLERMSDHLASRFKGLQMARQRTSVELIGVTATKLAVSDPSEAGVALLRGNDRMIVIFDSADMNAESLFVGGLGANGKPEVARESLMAFAHELGHIVAVMPGVKDAFEGPVKARKIGPVTWYAASNPKTEFFPEAFALYVGDPEWLKANRPDLFKWFETLSKG